MNERIRKLAIEADAWCDQNCLDTYDYNKQWETKFAELIVRECAGKVDWILAEGGKTQGDLIKEHFGVKE